MGFSERSMEMLGVMENSVRNNPDISFWKNRKVLITGHTGFKGSWLACYLNYLGSEVYGLSDAEIISENYERIFRIYKIQSYTIR